MPNHVHAIIVINNEERSRPFPTALPTGYWAIQIRCVKTDTSVKSRFERLAKIYYDHIIRDENEYLRVWKYIDENPIKWDTDEYYTTRREGS